ncbi:MAG: EAL domain-containing protein [Pseudomonadales bacterium]|nr:EAL domain-containing protein [Pseudomonadales bacterium]
MVFVSIILIESIVLFPSYFSRKQDIILEYERRGGDASAAVLDTLDYYAEDTIARLWGLQQALPDALSRVYGDKLKSFNLYSDQGQPLYAYHAQFTETPNRHGPDVIQYEWVLHAGPQTYLLNVTVNAELVSTSLTEFILQALGVALLVAVCVTLITMSVIRKKVLLPILRLREQLDLASEALTHPEDIVIEISDHNELGAVQSSFRHLLIKQFELLCQLHAKEAELQFLNDSLDSRVQERTLQFETANIALQQSLEDLNQAHRDIESLASFPEENRNPVLRIDQNGVLLYANPASEWFVSVLNARVDERLPSRWCTFLSKVMANGRSRKMVVQALKRYFKLLLVPIPRKGYINIYAEDITREKSNAARARKLAFYDPVTGLPNRVMFFDELRRVVQRSVIQSSQHSIVVFDLDDFGVINETFGQLTGDRVLRTVAERVKSVLKDLSKDEETVVNVMFARVGADEFALLFRNTALAKAHQYSSKIFANLSRPFTLHEQQMALTAPAGIATFDGKALRNSEATIQSESGMDSCFRHAQIALRMAAEQGKGSIVCFEKELGELNQRRNTLASQLKRAIEVAELRVYYQPKVDAVSGQIIGAEALVRWPHPVYSFVPPDEFISIAEENELIHPLGTWVMEQAVMQTTKWQMTVNEKMRIAVNLSPQQFRDSALVERIKNLLELTGINPATIELELTESMLMTSGASTIDALTRLKALGLKLAIDDFGTGYSSLAYLSRFPVDTLKIDRSFVMHLQNSAEDQSICRAVIQLAKSLGLETVAEGVELEAQLQWLAANGCDLIQGYYYSPPLPAQEFLELIHRNADLMNTALSVSRKSGI